MNGSEAKYSCEYVEIQTALEHIRTKLESIESAVREMHNTHLDLCRRVDQNQVDLASVKATAAIVGGLAGSVFAILLRLLLGGNV